MSTLELELELPPPIQPPLGPRPEFISFCHPANNHEFLFLPKVDAVRGSDTLKLHTKTALSACCIVAHNNPGFFALDRDRAVAAQNRIQAEFLDAPTVFYHLEEEPSPALYPIWTNFSDWEFPHDAPLPDWTATASVFSDDQLVISASATSQAVKDRDLKCRTTGYIDCLETAHLIPTADRDWVGSNPQSIRSLD
jgi:hypothetical protein